MTIVDPKFVPVLAIIGKGALMLHQGAPADLVYSMTLMDLRVHGVSVEELKKFHKRWVINKIKNQPFFRGGM